MLRLEIFAQIISIHIPEIGDTWLVDSLKWSIQVNKHETGDINNLTKSVFNLKYSRPIKFYRSYVATFISKDTLFF